MKKYLIPLVCLTVSLPARAQSLGFLQISSDAAVSGMAGAGVALHSNAPIDNNMADAALGTETLSVGAGYTLWQPAVASGYGLIGVNASYRIIPKLTVALSVKDFGSPSYDIVQADGRVTDTFKPMDLAIGAGAAYQLMDGLSVGVAAQFIHSSLGPEAKSSTVAVNLSAKYRSGGLQAGLGVNNIGGNISYGGDPYALPMLVKGGVAYTVAGFTAALEAGYVFKAGLMASLGLEYGFKDMLFVRGGYHYGSFPYVIPSHASLGLGVEFAGFRIDVSYLTASATLSNTLSVGLGYCF